MEVEIELTGYFEFDWYGITSHCSDQIPSNLISHFDMAEVIPRLADSPTSPVVQDDTYPPPYFSTVDCNSYMNCLS